MDEINVEIHPLDGKYYGTEISIKRNGLVWNTSLWNNEIFKPSVRELKYYNMNEKEWFEDDCGCDNHFESQETYDLVLEIKRRLEAEPKNWDEIEVKLWCSINEIINKRIKKMDYYTEKAINKATDEILSFFKQQVTGE